MVLNAQTILLNIFIPKPKEQTQMLICSSDNSSFIDENEESELIWELIADFWGAKSGHSNVVILSANVLHINVWVNKLSSSKYEELLVIFIDHKLTS